MGDMSTFLRNELRKHIFRTGSMTKPAALYISIHAGDPGRTGANEVAGGSYARVQRDPADANWSASSDGLTDNVAAITFPAPTGWTGAPLSITHAGAWDAASGGNFIGRAILSTPKTVNNGDPAPSFAIGALDFLFD